MAIAAAAGDTEVGRYVAEMLEIIGTDGVILIEDHAGRKTDREYVEGLQWDSGYVSAYFCTDLDRMEAVIENPGRSSVRTSTWRRWSRSCPSWSR